MPGAPFRLRAERAIRVTTSALAVDEAEDFADALVGALEPTAANRTA
jgi:hypothetical protein